MNAVGCNRVFEEKISGRDADRPELEKLLEYARPGDTIVVLELWRLGRNLQDLLTIVAGLRRRGIGFKSLHEALDTTTPGGRLIFHVFAALGEFIREMIVVGTHEGLAAARERGQRLGPPAMTEEQVQTAVTLLNRPENSVSSVAMLLGVSRSTIYKYVPQVTAAVGSRAGQLELPATEVDDSPVVVAQPMPTPPRSGVCPTCGNRPANNHEHEVKLHREALETMWLATDPSQPGQVSERWHCERCQPHRAELVMCSLCSNSVMLGDDLADRAGDMPAAASRWLLEHGWIQHGSTWYCGDHGTRVPVQGER